ncbi:MAG: hypothetical protein U0271_02735 [Polyangiaceae bacterium]
MRTGSIVFAAALALASNEARADSGPDAVPDFRIAMGPAVHVAPRGDTGVSYALDLTVGFTGVVGERYEGLVFNPELGYTFDTVGLHAFDLRFGIGGGNAFGAVVYQPHLLAGTLEGDTAIGVRNSLQGKFFADILSLEVGHQLIYADGDFHQSVNVMFGVNPASFLFLIVSAFSWLK